MPRFPRFARRVSRVGGSVFEKYKAKMIAAGDDLVKLHIGDSYAPPPYPLPIKQNFVESHPGFNRYCDTFGIEPLRRALATKVREDNGIEAGVDNVLITCGATNALNSVVQSIVDEGDEVILLAPFWPFFRGMVLMAGGEPVEVPFYTGPKTTGDDVEQLLAASLTERSVAIYLNSPNNPSGAVLSGEKLEAVAAFAKRHDLWLISDEAYDGMTYDDHVHHSPASFPGMAERTLSVFTFSKVYMFSGARVGYLVGAADWIRTINKALVHQLYSVSTVIQQMLVGAVETRTSWRGDFVAQARSMRDLCLDRLSISIPAPAGAYYLFFDATPFLHGRTHDGLVEACLDAGVSIAPGRDFGEAFATYVRICFAGESPARLETALDRLNRVLSA